MPIGETMNKALCRQLTAEFSSGYLYLSMAAGCDARGWPGMAAWMRMHAAEEQGHAMRFYHYLVEQGAPVRLGALEAPPPPPEKPEETVARALDHEREVTASIHALQDLAERERDRATLELLAWFAGEQVEEEKVFKNMLQEVREALRLRRMSTLDDALGEKASKSAAPSPLV